MKLLCNYGSALVYSIIDYYINTVGQYVNEEVIKKYLKNQGRVDEYRKIHTSQLKLF